MPNVLKLPKTQLSSGFLLISLAWAVGYNSREIRQVRELVEEHVAFFLEKWYEHLSRY